MMLILIHLFLVAAAGYTAFPPIDYSSDACLPCTVELDRGSLISMISEVQMCPNSFLYGLEVTEPFTSRIFTYSGVISQSTTNNNTNLDMMWAKTWQLRTVTVMRQGDFPHHILFPFVIDTGGYSTLLGTAASQVLRKFNVTESHGAQVGLCSLSVSLPIKSKSCVFEFHREGTVTDLRDNMVGENNARAIVFMDGLVTAVLMGLYTRDVALTSFMGSFGPSGASRDDAEREFDMTLRAPIVSTFPPAAAVMAILKHAVASPAATNADDEL